MNEREQAEVIGTGIPAHVWRHLASCVTAIVVGVMVDVGVMHLSVQNGYLKLSVPEAPPTIIWQNGQMSTDYRPTSLPGTTNSFMLGCAEDGRVYWKVLQ